ncbi:MAG: UDP-2,3-diacylglucosamine diphosphatase [Sphingomonadales bacterium]
MTVADRSPSRGTKIYFLSDFHLGAPNAHDSLERERIICRFLDQAATDAAEIFLMGDLFDFWYEYKKVVPKGFVRLLGKLAACSDAGITLHLFVGNHDMWLQDYFKHELGVKIYFDPITIERNGYRLHIGHGDGLGPGDQGYKRLKRIFRNPLCQLLFGWLPPVVGMGIAEFFSRKSRAKTGAAEEVFLGPDKEWLIAYCNGRLQQEPVDYFVFGHRHLPIDWELTSSPTVVRYINLGDWIRYYSYAVLDGSGLSLLFFTDQQHKLITNRKNL